MVVTLHVCVTCRAGAMPEPGTPCVGARLHAALLRQPCPEDVAIVAVECLSACARGASIALSAPGRWSYVYGDMGEDHAPDILTGAAAYARAADGLVPWRERVEIFRKHSIARIPPLKDVAS